MHDETTESRPLGRRARKAIAVRRALFNAGLAAFERQPVGLVSVLDITETADVAKGVFYLHFRSKDEYLIALLEDVQHRFLATVRDAVSARRSLTARIEATADRFAALADERSAEARYWIRMSSYFSGDVGEPGRLDQIVQTYTQELASILSAQPIKSLGPADLRAAAHVDAVCWALLRLSLLTDGPPCDGSRMARVAVATLRALERR